MEIRFGFLDLRYITCHPVVCLIFIFIWGGGVSVMFFNMQVSFRDYVDYWFVYDLALIGEL